MDRLRPNEREGKLLIDLEDIFNLKCLISKATRVTLKTQTLLDVILTNTPDLFGFVSATDLELIKYRSTNHLNKEERDLNKTKWNDTLVHDINERTPTGSVNF